MALVAAAAVAVAAWCAAAALGGAGIGGVTVPGAVLAALLIPGVALAARRRGPAARRVLPEGRDAVLLAAVLAAGVGALYLAGWTNGAHVGRIARLLPLVVVALSPLWPQPNVLRLSLLLAVGCLVGVALTPAAPPWAVVAALAAAALGLVATNRLASETAPQLGPSPSPSPSRRPDGRRLVAEAAALAALVAILAAAAAALVPPPPGQGGDRPQDRAGSQAKAAPAVDFQPQLDVGAGRGKRSDQVVFRVAAAGPDLWRATTYDRWDGESWSRTPDASPTSTRGNRPATVVPPGTGDPPGPDAPGTTGDFVQRVTVEARGTDVLVAAPRPTGVTLPFATVQVGDDASLRPSAPLPRGSTYTVTSARSAPGAGALRALGDIASTVPLTVGDRYLALPQVAPDVRALAARLTAPARSTYDKVVTLRNWLDADIAATDTATAVPAGADPLERVLLTDRAGSPERISAAFAVMLRSLGIPSRLAVGFLPGRRTGLGGEFEVRASDTHAWVEVWFPSAGWQRFDPTGRAPAPGAHDDSLWARLKRILAQLRLLLALAVLAAATWAAWLAHRWRQRRAALPWATRFFTRLERAGRARGRPRRPEETPKEYAAGLTAGVLPDPRLVEVGELVTVAAWSSRDPNREDKDRAETVLRQATRATPARRLRRHTRPRPPEGPTIPEP